MKTFSITLSVTCRLFLEIEARDELAAKLQATKQIKNGEHCLEHYIRDIELDDIEELVD
jgi:hypothetical protein